MTKPAVQLKNVNFIFDPGKVTEVRAVSNISLEITEGECVAFFGPSGCGKTTLLYIIAGIEKPQSGEVLIGGQDISKMSAAELAIFRQTKIGIIFQNFNLIPTISVLDNVALPMAFLGVGENERKIRAANLLKRFGLDHLAVRCPNELSGGQQQRVSIARSLANDPLIILADEPMGNLDTANAEIVLNQLKELNKEDGKTIIMVTHEIWTLRDIQKIFFLRDGKLIKTEIKDAQGPVFAKKETPQEISEMPPSEKKEENLDESLNIGAGAESEKGTGEKEKELNAVQTLQSVFPELTKQEIKIKAVTSLLLSGYGSEEQKRFESFLKGRVENNLKREEFFKFLDRPFRSGGIGLWKKTAEKLAKKSEEIIEQWSLIDQIIQELKKNPRAFLETEVEVISNWLKEDFKINLSPEQQKRLNEIIEEKIRNIISWENFEKILALTIKNGGIGLRGKTPHLITEKLKTAFTELKEDFSKEKKI
ncbi:MAG: ABC transporter ATP-binding protein [Patescibacteria group bacterium]|nr:ABC transporter ATP-binding protein [Patescibacteria group bacterium]